MFGASVGRNLTKGTTWKSSLENLLLLLPDSSNVTRHSFLWRNTLGRLLAFVALVYFITVLSLYLFSDELYILPQSRLHSSPLTSIPYQLSSWTPAGEEFDPHGASQFLLDPENQKHYRFAWRDWIDMHSVQDVDTIMSFCRELNKTSINELTFPQTKQMKEDLWKINGRVYLDNFAAPPNQVIYIGSPGVVPKFQQAHQRPRPKNKKNRKKEEEKIESGGFYQAMPYTLKDKNNHDETFVVPSPPAENVDLSHLKPYVSALEGPVVGKIDVELNDDMFKLDNYNLMFPTTPKGQPVNEEVAYHAGKFREWSMDLNSIPKYFHEIYLDRDAWKGAHYDWRFFNGLRQEEEHKAVMHHLIRVWAQFTEQESIVSWIAHGSLLGWYWNGLAMPWDSDNDVQMPIKELDRLARLYNQTLVVQDHKEGTGRYLIDVGSAYVQRDRGNGNNVIDARFIDTRSGIYLDITGLAETTDHPKKVHCKNWHFYRVDQISPLRRTMYEGVPVYIPKNYESILQQEYRQFRNREFDKWEFSSAMNMWTDKKKCKEFKKKSEQFNDAHQLTFYGACNDVETWREYNNTRLATDLHVRELDVTAHFEPEGGSGKFVSENNLRVYAELADVLNTNVPPFRDDIE